MLRLMLMLAALVAPPPPTAQVHVASPRPFEVWDGHVRGRVPAGSFAVTVTARGRSWQVPVAADGSFDRLLTRVPLGDVQLSVDGRSVGSVFGVPSGSLRPLPAPRPDRRLSRAYARAATRATPYVAAYTRGPDGDAGAYNAGAEFEAASTLKLPIMLVALSKNRGELSRSSYWDAMVRITSYSDNDAANELLEQTGGSDAGGAEEMVELMRSLNLNHTFMVGGYLTGGGGSPLFGVVDPPPAAYKHTTAGDMGTLAAMIVAAADGGGPLARHGIDRHEARELLYLMLHAKDPGLVPAAAGGLPVAHKIGWLTAANNDVAIVFSYRGPVVIAIYTNGTEDGTGQLYALDVVKTALHSGLLR